jgi:hypothetical protein
VRRSRGWRGSRIQEAGLRGYFQSPTIRELARLLVTRAFLDRETKELKDSRITSALPTTRQLAALIRNVAGVRLHVFVGVPP